MLQVATHVPQAIYAHGRHWLVVRHLGAAPGHIEVGIGLAVEVDAASGGFALPAVVHLITYDLTQTFDALDGELVKR